MSEWQRRVVVSCQGGFPIGSMIYFDRNFESKRFSGSISDAIGAFTSMTRLWEKKFLSPFTPDFVDFFVFFFSAPWPITIWSEQYRLLSVY
jgi:hypothetical protein